MGAVDCGLQVISSTDADDASRSRGVRQRAVYIDSWQLRRAVKLRLGDGKTGEQTDCKQRCHCANRPAALKINETQMGLPPEIEVGFYTRKNSMRDACAHLPPELLKNNSSQKLDTLLPSFWEPP